MRSLISAIFLLASWMAPAASFASVTDSSASRELSFIENKGQWTEQARFKAEIPGGAVFITDRGFVYNYYSEEDLERIHELTHSDADIAGESVRHHAYRVGFIGANSSITYRTDQKRSNYHNYFIGNDPSAWAGNVGLFGKVVQQNVYHGIDVAVYSKGVSLKYDFIVSPGADAGKIVMAFEGVQPQLQDNGNLMIRTSVNEIEELAPYSYQVIGGRETKVKCSYRLVKGRLSFDFPEGYDPKYPLVIDPQLIFATYSGGTGSGSGFYSYCTTYDQLGNLYAGSQAYQSGWPVTTGAFQSNFAGSQDVAVNKYNSTGALLMYSTYFGGNQVDLPHAMIVNDRDELVVTGSTTSSNLPVSQGCYDNNLSGSIDIFVAHFNSTGTGLIGATYVGGSNGNDINGIDMTGTSLNTQNKTSPIEVAFDAAGNIWVASSTAASDFPVAGPALQSASAGAIDGVLFQLNPSCTQLLYSTFLGGSGNDALYGLIFNKAGNIVVCGGTQSNNFPVTAGVLNTSARGGAWDGFVSIINPVTGALVQSTYVGTNGVDQAVSLQVDEYDNVYVLGRTLGDYPITPGVYSMPGADVFIDQLTPDLSASLRSTRVGNPQGGGRYSPTAFLLDICENVYVAGLGAASGLPLSPDAFETAQRSFWFCVLEPDFGGLMFASYFGTTVDHTHVGVSRLDPQGIVYHSVCSNSTTYPTTAGVWSPGKKTVSGQDIVSFKFNFDASGVRAGYVIDQVGDTGCAPFTVPFINTSVVADSFLWDFDNGDYSTVRSPTYTFTRAGVYTVRLYAKNDSSCVTHDTFQKVITVYPSPTIRVSPDTITCVNNPVRLKAEITHDPGVAASVMWTPAGGLDNPSVKDPLAAPLSDVTYKAVVTLEGGCHAEDSVHITVLQGFELHTPDTAICIGEVVQTRVTGDSRYAYTWTPSKGVSNTGITEPLITPDSSRTYVLTARYPGCRDSVRTLNIDVQPIPSVDLGADQILCYGDTLRMNPVIIPPGYPYYSYTWNPAGGLDTPNTANPLFVGFTTTTLTLTVSTPAGCTGTDDILLNVVSPDIITASADTSICPGDTIQLHVWGSQVSQVWRPDYYIDDTLSADPFVYPQTSVAYTVYGRDIDNCLDTQVVHVRVFPGALVEIPDSARIFPGEAYQMNPQGNCLYFEWFPPLGLTDHRIGNPVATPEVNTRYFLTGRTEYGCIAVDSMDLYVNLDSYIDMPNAFAPGSGPNSVLRPVRRGNVSLKSFRIYSRWGTKLYETSDIDAGWDGKYNDLPQPMGVYVYTVEAVTPSGRVFYKQGNVTLLR